jgi:hypothetical protein
MLSLEIMNSEMSGHSFTSVGSGICKHLQGRSQWLCSLRRELSLLARTLGLWFRIPLKAWMSACIYSVFMLSCIGSSLAMGWSPIYGVLLAVLGLRNWSETKCFMDALCSRVGATGKRERTHKGFRTYYSMYSRIFWSVTCLKNTVFWVIMTFSLIEEVYQPWRIILLPSSGWKKKVRNQQRQSDCILLIACFLTLQPWIWRRQVPLKCW